ncbi:hypothetical protein HK102_010669 [Quaeritorhiza haematococci]|nr:hypothetical protein HK102_010669 [Quaeritorhiza haematococci]
MEQEDIDPESQQPVTSVTEGTPETWAALNGEELDEISEGDELEEQQSWAQDPVAALDGQYGQDGEALQMNGADSFVSATCLEGIQDPAGDGMQFEEAREDGRVDDGRNIVREDGGDGGTQMDEEAGKGVVSEGTPEISNGMMTEDIVVRKQLGGGEGDLQTAQGETEAATEGVADMTNNKGDFEVQDTPFATEGVQPDSSPDVANEAPNETQAKASAKSVIGFEDAEFPPSEANPDAKKPDEFVATESNAAHPSELRLGQNSETNAPRKIDEGIPRATQRNESNELEAMDTSSPELKRDQEINIKSTKLRHREEVSTP